jgi:hypothetical protein
MTAGLSPNAANFAMTKSDSGRFGIEGSGSALRKIIVTLQMI